MNFFNRLIRSASRQLAILVGVIGMTFAAGIDWAQAAEAGNGRANAIPGEFHVILLFLLAIGVLAASLSRTRIPARVRGRPDRRRAPKR